jgi:hypothetical protein
MRRYNDVVVSNGGRFEQEFVGKLIVVIKIRFYIARQTIITLDIKESFALNVL